VKSRRVADNAPMLHQMPLTTTTTISLPHHASQLNSTETHRFAAQKAREINSYQFTSSNQSQNHSRAD